MAAAVDELDATTASIGARLARSGGDGDLSSLADLDVSVTTWLGGQTLSAEAENAVLSFSGAMGGSDPARIGALPILLEIIEGGRSSDNAVASRLRIVAIEARPHVNQRLVGDSERADEPTIVGAGRHHGFLAQGISSRFDREC